MISLIRFFRWLFRKRCRDRGLLFSRNNILIDREFEFMDGEACAYIEVWFDPERKFGLITPITGDVRVTYIIYYADGLIDDEHQFRPVTQGEKALIREMVDEVSLEETGMTIDEYWRALEDESRFGGVIV